MIGRVGRLGDLLLAGGHISRAQLDHALESQRGTGEKIGAVLTRLGFLTEEQLTDEAVPYVTGIARWSELARGLMTGDEDGLLKLLVSPVNRCLLGVHVIGTGATDLVHIGQAVMASGPGGLDFLVTAVFNYPTFAESYKVAALDADNRIRAMKSFVV